MEVNLTFEGHEFLAEVDEEMCHLSEDKNKTLVWEHLIPDFGKTEKRTSSSEDFSWSHEIITTLLQLRLDNECEFKRPVCKKNKLWNSIAAVINETHNCSLDGHQCDVKYRNLLATYRINKRKSLQQGEKSVNWIYFKMIDLVLGSEDSTIHTVTPVVNIVPSTEESHNENVKDDSIPGMSHTFLNCLEKKIIPTNDTLSKKDFIWSHDIIKLLLTLRLEKEGEFIRPKCKKNILWDAIAIEINKTANCSIDGPICDSKYRNLLATYRANKRKSLENGEDAVNWKYFKMIDQVLGSKFCAITLPSTDEDDESVDEDSLPETRYTFINCLGKLNKNTSSNKDSVWSHKITKMLLTLRLEKKDEFDHPNCKKKRLWEAIAVEISKMANCSIDGRACNNKFRRLLATYRSNIKKGLEQGEEAVNWKYLKFFDELLGNKASTPPHTSSSLEVSYVPPPIAEYEFTIKEERSPGMIDIHPENETTMNFLEENLEHRTPTSNEPFLWSHPNIKLLLTLRLKKEDEFRHPTSTKKKLWDDIAVEINKAANSSIDGPLCDSKYRNLLNTYRNNKKKVLQYGEHTIINWKYFKHFDKVFGNEYEKTAATLEDNGSDQEESSTEPTETFSEAISSLKGTLQHYFKKKLEMTKENNSAKLEFEKQMWEEKKALKEKQIEAINALANALLSRRQTQAP